MGVFGVITGTIAATGRLSCMRRTILLLFVAFSLQAREVARVPMQVIGNKDYVEEHGLTKLEDIAEKKLPILADIRDESDEAIRIVLEPRSRTVDPQLLMDSLFRLTELEVRFGLNMNVLSAGQIPNVLSLRDVLSQWLEHRIEVLVEQAVATAGFPAATVVAEQAE